MAGFAEETLPLGVDGEQICDDLRRRPSGWMLHVRFLYRALHVA